MSRPKSFGDCVESSAGSVRSTRKEAPSAAQARWSINRERSGKFNDSPLQDSVAGLDRMENSIWDLTKGVKQDQSLQRPLIVRWTWARIRQDAWTLGQTVRSYPLVALIPLVVWMLMVGGGIYAVAGAANRESQHRRQLATQIASDKAQFLATELAKVFMPAYVCSVYVRRDPDWAAVNRSFAPMALEMIRLSNAGSILTLSLIPNGVIYTMVPLKGSSPSDDPNWRAIGKDWLQDKFNEDKVLQAINTTNLTIIGPYNLTQGGVGLVAMLSIRILGAPPNATFGTPPYVHGELGPWQTPPRVQLGPNTTGTPFAPYMYNDRTASKWWGLTTVLISWDVLREKVMQLQNLEELSYRYVLSRPALRKELLLVRPDLANGSHELAVAWSADVQPVPPGAKETRPLIYYGLEQRLVTPAVAKVAVEGSEMTLFLEPLGGWMPHWRLPLLVVVAVGSMLVAAMLFIILLNRRQHLRLLHAMIPKKVISTIRRGDTFAESFDCVTILFSDIVSYTSMSAQMAPIEVVQMLDELYKEYDNLTEKHQLYKVETIGDAFMVVGGAPEPMQAVEAARRVAQLALDMVELTRSRVLSGGQVLRIRVGIHSGPVVAAVVGRKMPRYCLFGDTVNTASRMESNGSPMRIHISGATAELLREAGGFVLQPRGDVPIKGKGCMSTFWVSEGVHQQLPQRASPVRVQEQAEEQEPGPEQQQQQDSAMSPLRLGPSGVLQSAGPSLRCPSLHTQLMRTASGEQPSPRSLQSPPPPGSSSGLTTSQLLALPCASLPRLASPPLRRDLEAALEGCRDGESGSPKPQPRGTRFLANSSPLRVSSGQVLPKIVSESHRQPSLDVGDVTSSMDGALQTSLFQTHSSGNA